MAKFSKSRVWDKVLFHFQRHPKVHKTQCEINRGKQVSADADGPARRATSRSIAHRAVHRAGRSV